MLRLLLLAVLVSVLPACTPAPLGIDRPAPALVGQRPPDFTLALSVYAPTRARPADLPRSLRPGRFVVEPEGSLRHGAGTRVQAYPPLARQLSPQQMDQLWRLVRDSGLLDRDHPARVADPVSISPSPNRSMAIMYVVFGGERRTLRLLLDRSDESALAAERISDHLADLAFVQ